MDHVLDTHSILRYLVLLFGIYAITKSYRGFRKNRAYGKNDNLSATLFVASVHLQALLGLVLYFKNDWYTRIGTAFQDMSNSYLRFFAIEHIFGMLVAVVLIQMGRSMSKKATDDAQKHRIAFKFFLIGMIIMLATIPGPFREALLARWWPA